VHNAVLAIMVGLGFLLLTAFATQRPRLAQVIPLQLSLGVGIGIIAAIAILALRVDLIPDNLEAIGLVVLLCALALVAAAILWRRQFR
jgi:xanthine/uracil/vitamin C permease (AzgA family)